jgi:predicted ATP-grasp superfamily ATP-dependent carboligase
MPPTPSHPPAVVLSCSGAPEGDLNLVRALGEMGVHVVVVSEYPDPPAARSKHCAEHVVVPNFTRHPARLLDALTALKQRHSVKSVVFPSADPDLTVLTSIANEIDAIACSTVLEPDLTRSLMDKRAFDDIANLHNLSKPRTYKPSSLSEIEMMAQEATFPLIAKPAHPVAWHKTLVRADLRYLKALPLPDAACLSNTAQGLGPALAETLIQEFVPGDDEEHYDVHAYIGKNGQALGTFAGQKWRINPPHAGSGCFVQGIDLAQLEVATVKMLNDIGYRGQANVNYKRHAKTGEFKLLEINPRVSQWNILGTRSGVNLPWLAYQDMCNREPEKQPERRNGLYYVNARTDIQAFRIYHREGHWGLLRYLQSLMHPNLVCQFLQLDDPGPAVANFKSMLTTRLRRRRQA